MALLPKISFPIPANGKGKAFENAEALLALIEGESSGLYLVGSQGMWHGGIHITNTTAPWCALTGSNASELAYVNKPYLGEQTVNCMAGGEIVAYRVCEDYDFIEWRGDNLYLSASFLLVKHTIQPGEKASSALTFYTLYMNLAPASAYGQNDASLRETIKGKNYYSSQDDVNAEKVGGEFAEATRVTLSNEVMTSTVNQRQFTEVTVVNNSGSLKAGDKVWTVSDQGWLKQVVVRQVKAPSWWKQCSPAYHTGPTNRQDYKTNGTLKYYLSSEDVSAGKSSGNLPKNFLVTLDSGAPVFTRTTDKRIFSLLTLGKDHSPLNKGDRVWVISDNDNLTAVGTQSAGAAKYGVVVVPEVPIAIDAGDSIGHLGFHELPEENGKRSRYQVHIECLSADSKLPTFLTNPDKVGQGNPPFLKYAEGAELYMPDKEGKMVKTTRKSRAPGILTRSKVPGVDADGKTLPDNLSAAYYQVRPEGGWMAAADVKKVAQFDLASLGFVTLDKTPESFDLIDGIHHPDNAVKGILVELYKAAQAEKDASRALNQYNYERLLKQIDTNNDGQYSEQEYLQAVHNPSYRDHLYRIIVKHPSEWYYGKDDTCWKTYLDTLTRDTSLAVWKAYTEAFIEKMTWMKKVPGMVGEPWHMHPVVFLGSFIREPKITKEMLRKIWTDSVRVPDELLNAVAEELNASFKLCRINTKNRLNHFMAQVFQEVGSKFNINENFNYRPNVLVEKFAYYAKNVSEAEADGFIPGKQAANAENIANKAYADRVHNGKYESGDGWRYRGRGMKQLTFRGNYRSFTIYHEGRWGQKVDFEAEPDLLLESIYAVRSALYFWDFNNLPTRADQGVTKDVSYSITKIVNLHDDHYDDRFKNLERLLREGVFNELF